MTTRREILLLLRKTPGITVRALAAQLNLTSMGVRRHLDALLLEGVVETVAGSSGGVGRPASGWRLSPTGMELFPRRYDAFAVELLEDLGDELGAEAVDAVLERRTDKLVAEYLSELDGSTGVDRVQGLTRLRDEAGYLAEWQRDEGGDVTLTENNCAVHRVAEQNRAVCDKELALFQRVMGPGVEVTRTSHTINGDAVCTYTMRAIDGASVDGRGGFAQLPSETRSDGVSITAAATPAAPA